MKLVLSEVEWRSSRAGVAVLRRMGTIQHAAEYGGVPPIPPYGPRPDGICYPVRNVLYRAG